MENLRLSFILLVALGFLCTVDSNPISSLFGKSDDKAEADDKEVATTAKLAGDATTTTTTATTTTTTTTAAPEPSSSCGGLKGFLHLCEKSEPTEPPKSVKARSVPEEEDGEESDSDDESSEEEKKIEARNTSVASESTEGVAKRQVGDPEAPILGEVPPMVGDALSPPVEPSEGEDGTMEKRQADDDEEEKTDEVMEVSRQRRDCRDRDGDYEKDCRKKREYVPCIATECREAEATTESQLK